jgi:outer membrane lipoprotein SlyB
MKNLIVMGVMLLGLASLGGCASSNSGSAYSRGQARTEQTVRMGVVEHVRDVQIEGTKTGAGGAAGGVVGGVAGSSIGQGKGSAIGAVVGAVAGAVVGGKAEEAATKRQGLEITVKLDSGSMVAIVQEADEQFGVGDRVRILSGQGVSRVTH